MCFWLWFVVTGPARLSPLSDAPVGEPMGMLRRSDSGIAIFTSCVFIKAVVQKSEVCAFFFFFFPSWLVLLQRKGRARPPLPLSRIRPFLVQCHEPVDLYTRDEVRSRPCIHRVGLVARRCPESGAPRLSRSSLAVQLSRVWPPLRATRAFCPSPR